MGVGRLRGSSQRHVAYAAGLQMYEGVAGKFKRRNFGAIGKYQSEAETVVAWTGE